jgi:hypothetical protein
MKLATTGEVVENYIQIITKEKKCRRDAARPCASLYNLTGTYGS